MDLITKTQYDYLYKLATKGKRRRNRYYLNVLSKVNPQSIMFEITDVDAHITDADAHIRDTGINVVFESDVCINSRWLFRLTDVGKRTLPLECRNALREVFDSEEHNRCGF